MLKKPFYVELNVSIRTMDIPSMTVLADDEYRSLFKNELFWVDHHNILRVENTGQPIATSVEQLNIMIEELEKMKSSMISRKHHTAG